MKREKQDYRSLLVQYKETKCEMEMLNGELTETYSKIKFLELEVIRANAKVERVPPRSLMMYLLIKNHSLKKADWDTLERAVRLLIYPWK